MRRRRIILDDEDEDPLSGVANLFDVAMVFAVALLVALVVAYNVPELLDDEADLTVVKNPGQPNMQIIIKEGKTLKVLNMTEELAGGQGSRMGTAYRLESGEIIYVPDDGDENN
ncbi:MULTISPECIES: DUF2149 domain-containing protein [Methanoculleus]|uniref:DUF2149 domain-containing protein n=2 Tax=Methanoculleus TaxID=45989 RepID=A3CRH6_METMJ|nr:MULTISPECIES: DUF2149 domain-containing protein [Methanoculleus]ABN55976.1 conserved hypothetical protein [Methanoculleus marisnigri JR1]MCC7555017.1 DUF2149 domain-containing protein [Methanoculleus marisnigri]UYU17461.1 DUF2149 domain-containing protein [Methanoculleus submarinus]